MTIKAPVVTHERFDVDHSAFIPSLSPDRSHGPHHRGYRIRASLMGRAAYTISPNVHFRLRPAFALPFSIDGACASDHSDFGGDHRRPPGSSSTTGSGSCTCAASSWYVWSVMASSPNRRPSPENLTEFYFFLSLGGGSGGVFNALAGACDFSDVWEYPMALVAACLVRPPTPQDKQKKVLGDIGLPFMLLAFVMLARNIFSGLSSGNEDQIHRWIILSTTLVTYVFPALVLVHFSPRRWRFGLAIALYLFVLPVSLIDRPIVVERNFFGVHRVGFISDVNTQALILMNGRTLHGAKSLAPNESKLPMAYYSPEGPFDRFLQSFPIGSVHRVAVIGLGGGDLSRYARDGQEWTFYDIDPIVERIATDRDIFNSWSDAQPAREL